jgi:hypothetical protein
MPQKINSTKKTSELEEESPNEVWLDKQDILERMHISSRTLQTWRSKKIIPFTKIGRKIYYREEDLRRLLG